MHALVSSLESIIDCLIWIQYENGRSVGYVVVWAFVAHGGIMRLRACLRPFPVMSRSAFWKSSRLRGGKGEDGNEKGIDQALGGALAETSQALQGNDRWTPTLPNLPTDVAIR